MWRILLLLVLSVTLLLSGCGDKSKRAKLHDYVASVKARPAKKIQPLPVFKKRPNVHYQAADLRSPFQSKINNVVADNTGLRPDVNRAKEPLEEFPLDALRMVGILTQGDKVWALVEAPGSEIFRVTEGEHIGKNFGKIGKITPTQIDISETVTNTSGGWVKQEASLKLESDQ